MLSPKRQPHEAILGAELKTSGAGISDAQAEAIAEKLYGLAGKAKWIWGEKDANFRLTLDDGREFLLKILNPAEDASVTALHSSALLHVEKTDPSIPLQRIIRTQDGAPDGQIADVIDDAEMADRSVRLVTFVPGLAQRDALRSAAQRRNIGATLARLQLALADFSHPAADHKISWNMSNALSLRAVASVLPDAQKQDVLAKIFDAFERQILPVLPSLPSQVIHSDFNRANILVDPDAPEVVTGIIDFGDMVRAPVLFDVAIGVSYHIGEPDDPVADMLDFMGGYAGFKRLEPQEIDLLYTAILTRLAMRIAIQEHRSTLFPDQRAVFTRNVPVVWAEIDRLMAVGEAEIGRRVASVFD